MKRFPEIVKMMSVNMNLLVFNYQALLPFAAK